MANTFVPDKILNYFFQKGEINNYFSKIIYKIKLFYAVEEILATKRVN